jgi:hypothetical protein
VSTPLEPDQGARVREAQRASARKHDGLPGVRGRSDEEKREEEEPPADRRSQRASSDDLIDQLVSHRVVGQLGVGVHAHLVEHA